MIRVSVLYPNEQGKKFDHDYFVNKHMKLVRERLTSFGLVRTEVDKGKAGGAPGGNGSAAFCSTGSAGLVSGLHAVTAAPSKVSEPSARNCLRDLDIPHSN